MYLCARADNVSYLTVESKATNLNLTTCSKHYCVTVNSKHSKGHTADVDTVHKCLLCLASTDLVNNSPQVQRKNE